ncbi:MAG: hypothetical protein DSY90_09740 [Deltaproteobacteria bacterium]|nr:MAG: hypothetical protein DSY90_09740 [Deltaproteobacteria bacterium]RUA01098.1 MAG: hypothetical protein DSY89_05440 [Deltaproteobacteria bacterium]
MLNIVKGLLHRIAPDQTAENGTDAVHEVHVAVCALLVEMARIDNRFTPAEMDFILGVIREKYGLSEEHAEALMAEAEKELDNSVDLWQFAKRINTHYSVEEKLELIKILWEIIFVDGKMDRYENYLVHKLSDLLHLSHRQLIDAKLNVLHPK